MFMFSDEELKTARSKDLLPILCEYCGKFAFKQKVNLLTRKERWHHTKPSVPGSFCSRKCGRLAKTQGKIKHYNCKFCGKGFSRSDSKIKSENIFCSSACSATYNNANRSGGTSRSKLESCFAEWFRRFWPSVKFETSYRSLIPGGLELDFAIPSIKMAIEFNGPCHYYPIYGTERLDGIRRKDKAKALWCLENDWSLFSIDVYGFCEKENHSEDMALMYAKLLVNSQLINTRS